MPEHIKVLVVMNGIAYESEEARQKVESLLEQSSLQVESVSLLHTVTRSGSAKKSTKKKSTKKKSTKKRKKKSTD